MAMPADWSGNRILDGLPRREREQLQPLLERVSLPERTVLQSSDEEITHVYFPIEGIGSLVAMSAGGETVDTALVGNEGMLGIPVFLGTGRMPVEAIVQIEMDAFKLSARDLRAHLEDRGELVNLLQRYTQMVMVELAQLILCNRVHSLEQRCARWILQVQARLKRGSEFQVTQQFVSEMLGANRPPVTEILQDFRSRGFVELGRGTMRVVDETGLESASCECYRVIRSELERLLAARDQYELSKPDSL